MLLKNLQERNQKKKEFWAFYISFLALSALCFYFTFWLIPKIYYRNSVITIEQTQNFLKYLNETEAYIITLEKQQRISQESATAVFNRIQQLESNFNQPFFRSVLNSYRLRLTEQVNSAQTDTTLIDLQEQIKKLNLENETLLKTKKGLQDQIDAKTAVTN